MNDRPTARGDLQRTITGGKTILTVDGRVHLSISPEEATLVSMLDGQLSRVEMVDLFGPDTADLLDDLNAAGFLVDSPPFNEPRVALSAAGFEFAGFDRVVSWFYRALGRLIFSTGFVVSAAVLVFLGLVATFRPPSSNGAGFPGW